MPDKALRANSSDTPPGCKRLASDRGWPEDYIWRKALPDVFKKLKGTEAPDYFFQAQNVADVQKAINFARDHNVRLSVIGTGHDFIGR
jgi:FAD/FMN-containing dehydrogenase